MWTLILWSSAGNLTTVSFNRESDADDALVAFLAGLAGSGGIKVRAHR